MEKDFSRISLFELLKECPDRAIEDKLTYMENKVVERTNCPESRRNCITQALKYFKSDFKKKWAASHNTESRFLAKNEKWLESTIKIPYFDNPPSHAIGRPQKEFGESSERSKRRKTEEIRKLASPEELTFAASMSHRAYGNLDAAHMINKIVQSPTRAARMRDMMKPTKKQAVVKHTPEEALAIFVEADLTRKQYEVIHSANKAIYPCYSLVKKAKKDCYPNEDSIFVNETIAEVTLQGIIDHTTTRLCKYLEEVLVHLTEEEQSNLELICKWGCDGSQQTHFKQKFEDGVGNESDANIFQTSFVPLTLMCNVGDEKNIIWQNPVPSSTRFCRPIRIRFVKETTDITNSEIHYIENQIKELNPTEIPKGNGVQLKIKHTLLFTMVDGKICNAATSTSSTMRCYICGETSKNFNDLNKKLEEDSNAIKFGISVLHARIRLFETLLHLSYKIPIKKWQTRNEEDKKLVEETKKNIQELFKKEMGILVDVPKQGFGNTNDGNTSRRFFANPDIASRITGVDVRLIQKIKIILEAISSGHRIDCDKFDKFAKDTAKLYVELYGWYPMTPTLHKVLMHGASIIKNAILPIGQLSEEAAEARNKHFRQYRLKFSRKFSRTLCNRDVLNRLLLTSDPLLSCSRKTPGKKTKPFSSETLDLLLPATPPAQRRIPTTYLQEIDEEEDSEEEKEEESDSSTEED